MEAASFQDRRHPVVLRGPSVKRTGCRFHRVAKPVPTLCRVRGRGKGFVEPGQSRPIVSVSMTEVFRPRAKYVIGPDGSPLTIADLPPTTTKRWVIRRKAEVVAAVRGGLLSLDEACQRYTLTVEEFLSWQQSIDEHGLAGLRTTRIQHYRQ